MDYTGLKESVCDLNREIKKAGLVTLTWGNASAVDREQDVMAIKSSGTGYDALSPDDIVVLSLKSGDVVDGELRPSTDTPTHLCLYRHAECIGSVIHTHSTYATAFCQAEKPIPCQGTTHADHFYGEIPLVRNLTSEEIKDDYEQNAGMSIVDCFEYQDIKYDRMPAALLPGHAPFVWGPTPQKALENAVTLEYVAQMALITMELNPEITLSPELLDKHFLRKHGKDAYYGQK